MPKVEFRERVSRVSKRVPEEDAEHWVLAVFISLTILILLVVMR